MNTEDAVKQILADITDRRGWRQEWDQFDEDIRQEIRDSFKAILDNLNRVCDCTCGACFHCTQD